MILFIITYLGGVLTILSPCILPVLPFVFSKAQQSFLRSGLPLLAGMAVTFSGLSALAIAGGELLVQANDIGRTVALIFFSILGASLLMPHLSDKIFSPLAKLGAKMGTRTGQDSMGGSFVIGIGTGLLWAPCAGPILGLVLTGASAQGNLTKSVLLLLSYSLGAATSLGLALFAGKKVFAKMKQFLGVERWIRKIMGALILVGVVIIAFNLDRTVLTQVSKLKTESLEQKLLGVAGIGEKKKYVNSDGVISEGNLPDFSGLNKWLNTTPLTKEDLKGKVVLIDIWTYSCINCLRTLPYVKNWFEKYKDSGLVVIGVHSPEFAFERIEKNVEQAVKELGIVYPVVMDNEFKIWNELENSYWPAHYFIDRQGRIRYHHFGEGSYEESEQMIRSLLEENGEKIKVAEIEIKSTGVTAKSDLQAIRSPETYLGYDRAENFMSTPRNFVIDRVATYKSPKDLPLNTWSLDGQWKVETERSVSKSRKSKISFRFMSRDLHLVLAAPHTVKFKVKIDGKAPGKNRGLDIDENGYGEIQEQRLYQLLRLPEVPTESHLFEIEFQDSDAEAYAFTFG